MLLVVLGAAAIARNVWLRRGAHTTAIVPVPKLVHVAPLAARPVDTSARGAPGIEFDKLASYISHAGLRVDLIAQTQSAAALKLDTVEVAVNRLVADMSGIMAVPRAEQDHAVIIAAAPVQSPQQASIAA